ncbi:bcep22gp48 domain protein [Achromobacter xylosoxidans A8]|uniref:Bcep22gp48 domain protein n=1 Tax=Achromobacter xylosoxidans (strain A8) TaxID=762376 RepID=E3HTT7_ACHXA|nr:DUF4031 domain-containing protein [Achromobacter xylosoxidans]ADP17377.1 bcep22gp48 domain protein [Achromobacter xylosoxidans A8]
MAVYVDNMQARFGRMVMCHMVADTDDELHAMAARIGVARRHHQSAGTYRSHYDICMTMRTKAVNAGAQEINRAELGALLKSKRQAVAKAKERT